MRFTSYGLFGPVAAPDDRGRGVELVSVAVLKRSGDHADPARAALAKRMRLAVKGESERLTWRNMGWSVLGLTFLFVVLWAVRWLWPGMPYPMRMGLFWGGIAAVTVALRMRGRALAARSLAATVVAEGVCGSCGYTLERLVTEEDGCVVCPECGAGWRAVRITRPHWAAEELPRVEQAEWLTRFFFAVPKAYRLMTPDGRGRYVSVVDSRLRRLPARRRRELGTERIRYVKGRMRRIGRVWRWHVAALLICSWLLAGWFSSDISNGVQRGDVAMVGVLGVIFVLPAAIVVLGHAFLDPAGIASVMTEEGMCAGCAAGLPESEIGSDGCVVCRECGSAWRVGDGERGGVGDGASPDNHAGPV